MKLPYMADIHFQPSFVFFFTKFYNIYQYFQE